jgi:rhodanese-related sulfurtransferase
MKTINHNILIALILAAILASCGGNGDGFKLSIDESVTALLFSQDGITPEEIMEAVNEGNEAVVLVDVRSPGDFIYGHLQNAINVPTQQVLEPSSMKLWKKSEVVYYFYGATQAEAHAPWMILKQLGYDNIRVLQGGMAFFADFSDSSFLKLEDETARYDYAAIFSKAIEAAEKANAPAPKPEAAPQQAQPKKVVPQQRPKIPVPDEEEEGC